MKKQKNALKGLTRLELLELLGQQQREIDKLHAVIESQNAMLEQRKVTLETSGSLAEAALRLGGIFEAADRAVRIYQESMGLPEAQEFPEEV